ncbi:hypothetical protein BA896_003025 [Janthinobacterium lividum]|uniref:Uncharacterized protein n=1 Tax=Janthinobacterium lividum TaxID=29581 RepID=A0A1E8PPG1_9BURK|nr:hypothetical protein BA896_003025 [Janthinobacterium lividum]
MWGDERPVPSELEAARMSKDQIRHYGLGGAYQKRWNKVTKIRTELQTELLEAEAIWGRTVYEKFEPVFKLQQELFSSVQIFLLACDPNESKQARDANQDIFTKGRDILYNRSLEKPDPFTKDITNAIKTIEDFLRPHLKK